MRKIQEFTSSEAVSAVIGVTLMVAVTVAMAAVGYAYFTGMIGGNVEVSPIIDMSMNQDDNTLTLTYKDIDFTWESITIRAMDATNTETLDLAAYGLTGEAEIGDKININDATTQVSGTVTITITHTPSGTLMNEYIFKNVI